MVQTTQQELPEPEYRFENAKHRFHRALALSVERLASLGLEPMPHDLQRGCSGGKRRGLGEALKRILMMVLTRPGDERFHPMLAAEVDISLSAVAGVGNQRAHFPEL